MVRYCPSHDALTLLLNSDLLIEMSVPLADRLRSDSLPGNFRLPVVTVGAGDTCVLLMGLRTRRSRPISDRNMYKDIKLQLSDALLTFFPIRIRSHTRIEDVRTSDHAAPAQGCLLVVMHAQVLYRDSSAHDHLGRPSQNYDSHHYLQTSACTCVKKIKCPQSWRVLPIDRGPRTDLRGPALRALASFLFSESSHCRRCLPETCLKYHNLLRHALECLFKNYACRVHDCPNTLVRPYAFE